MATMKRIEGVERGLSEDLEPGALCWSMSHHSGGGFVGGIVTDVTTVDADTGELYDDPLVSIIRWSGVGRGQTPWLWDTTLSDIDHELTTFFSSACTKEADRINAWLGRLDKTERANHRSWIVIANSLSLFGASGPYTPRAEARYEETRADRRAAADAARLPEIDVTVRAAELAPKLEAAIEAARARKAAS